MNAGDVLLFLHADTVLPPDFAQCIFRAMSDPRAAGGAFRHRTDYRRHIMTVLEWLVHLRSTYLHLPYGDQGIFVRRLARQGRIVIVPAPAVTSGRRWRDLGPIRTTIINQLIVAGCWLGVTPERLAKLY